jgi:hypothetical protein
MCVIDTSQGQICRLNDLVTVKKTRHTTYRKIYNPATFLRGIYSRTSNNGHCRGIQILSVIGGVR